MENIKSRVSRVTNVKPAVCPECQTKTHRILLAGKQAICINAKCNITRFTIQNFGKPGVKYVHIKPGRPGKSYNNSDRGRRPKTKRGRRGPKVEE